MRHIDNGLEHPFVKEMMNFIDKERQHNRRGKGKDQLIERNQDRIAQHAIKRWIVEKVTKMFEAHPRAAPNAIHQLIFFEGDYIAQHRVIAKQDEKGKGRDQHQIEKAMIPNGREQRCPVALFTNVQPGLGGSRCRQNSAPTMKVNNEWRTINC